MRAGLRNKVLLLGASTVLACVAGEVLLRTLGYYGVRSARIQRIRLVDDPVIDYRNVPGTAWIYNNLSYEISQHGWRDYDYSYQKPAGSFRIVVLGDSVTNGHGVNLSDIYAKRLEEKLNGRDGSAVLYQVILLSVGALNTEQEVHLLEVEGLKYNPDLVLVGYVLNDPEEGVSMRRTMAQAAQASPLARLKRAAQHSSLIHLGYRTGQRLIWRLRVALGNEEVAHYVRDDYFTALHRDSARWGTVLEAFDRLGELTQARRIPVALAVFPILHDLENYAWAEVHQQVRTAALARGFEVLDLLPTFAGHRESDLQVTAGDHVHPGPLGHRLAGDAIHDFLHERELLPDGG